MYFCHSRWRPIVSVFAGVWDSNGEARMASRLKEDEKNERIIRGLLKLPENRRCINCNSLGPQYVCTNFWTFVCTTCSGIHREFTHRVKSVSMANFTTQEVSALQEGGNQRAKDIYFKEWDPQRNSSPDSSNVERLRDFIKHVYVDRRYTGERNYDKPPRVKMGDKEDEYRRTDSYQGGSRSPPYEDSGRYSGKSSPGGRSYDERRSPGYDQESRQYGDYRKSPVRHEIVNDWRRDDRFGNERRYEDRRISDGDSKLESRSPERPKDLDSSSPPIVRPVRDILGENTIPLRISEPPKPGGRTADGSAHTQRTVSSSSLGSNNGNQVEVKVETPRSLIDFDADPEPPVAAAVPQAQQSTTVQPTAQPANSANDNNWASFDVVTQPKVPQAPSNVNSLESVLSQLSISAPAAAHVSITPGNAGPLMTAAAATSVSNLSTFPPSGASMAAPVLAPVLPGNGGNSFVNVPGAGQWSTMHQQPSLFPATGNQSTTQSFIRSVAGPPSNQPWNIPAAPNVQGHLSSSAAQATQAAPKPVHEVTSGVASQPSADIKSAGRRELPQDLFTASHPAFHAPVPGWQAGVPGGMGFSMQYRTAMPMSTFQQSSKSINPFDVNSEPTPVQAPTFPSMASLQGTPPNMLPPSGLVHTSSVGTPPAWMPQSSSYTPGLLPQAPPYASSVSPRTYMGQQVPNNMPPSGHQGVPGFGSEGAAFGSLNLDQQLAGRFSAPSTPSPFSSVGGNPFG
ncbi:probable ADP-ribosylation factor GTPase-activating protein AGD14 isoform X2 [Ziziphus jujuba]|uniref:Probable ADP-ribosylation factor GTPase-activating protein AGD14 isoform X2 n=1 Tax=Ziziphus jujuba TaxID=326968 RepID=A0ABM3I5T4_ZIZJJ|nr:probable ADP-ribosylation factor GTPase-activating protein AGD14 isoform X2 [Ziziphus jujuba]